MQIRVTGLENFKHSIMAAEARLENRVNERYREVVKEILTDLVASTPQWSGDLAASWTVATGRGNQSVPTRSGYTQLKKTPFEFPRPVPGNSLGYAMAENYEAISAIKWNSYVSIVNNSKTLTEGDRGDNPYGSGGTKRPQLIDADFAGIAQVKARYSSNGMRLGSTV